MVEMAVTTRTTTSFSSGIMTEIEREMITDTVMERRTFLRGTRGTGRTGSHMQDPGLATRGPITRETSQAVEISEQATDRFLQSRRDLLSPCHKMKLKPKSKE